MKIRNESINKNYLTPSIIFTLSIATVFGIGIYNAANIANTSNANALSYSTSKDISFTFAPTLSIGLSTDSLTIDNLVPGTTSDSNKVSVTVSSNTPYGYVLSAGVGSTVSTDPYYNTSDLVHDNSTTEVPTTNKFSSIATSASLQTLDADNTWGYSTSTDGGTSWSTYSGLSHTVTKPLLDISAAAQPSTIDFKIAARSASTQASGTYNNVITFYAVGKPKVMTIDDLQYMQDFKDLIDTDKQTVFDSMPVGQQYKLIDSRDDNVYWLAKQADGNIWMTQNLDLCIGCDGVTTLTSQNTDLNESGSGAYIDGYADIDGVINWTPDASAISSSHTIDADGQVSDWLGYSSKPYSAEGDNVYVYTSNSGNDDFIYNSLSLCTDSGYTADDCLHYHVGNYYNWPAAIASNRSYSLTTKYSTAGNSICPAGWRLPKGRAASQTAETNEFGELLRASGITSSLTATSYATDGFNNLRTFPLYFSRSGNIFSAFKALKNRGAYGYFWSSTVSSYGYSYDSSFGKSSLYTNTATQSDTGYPIRCLVK